MGLLWGHITPGLIKVSRPICRRYESPTDFVLARSGVSGKKCTSWVHHLGHYHIKAKHGPHPVSLVEMCTSTTSSIPIESVLRLHAVALGHPVVGEDKYIKHEKYYNPVIPAPVYKGGIQLQRWLRSSSDPSEIENFTSKLLDFRGWNEPLRSRLHKLDIVENQESQFPGEESACNWTDHPESVTVRRDRGRPRAKL